MIIRLIRDFRLLVRLEHGDWFNASFGLVLAPTDFGSFSHKLIVGHFGSGEILAFDAITGHFEGKLRDQNDNVIVLRGYGAFRLALDRKAALSEADVIRLAEMSAPQLHLLFHWLVHRLSLAQALSGAKHGIKAWTPVLPSEREEDWAELRDGIDEDWRPGWQN